MSEEILASKLERFGLRFTKVYLLILAGGIPAAAYLRLIDLEPLKLNELGDFLAGAFGPLAIFWLVLGFFQQGRELRHSVTALNLQAEELKNSVKQQHAMVEITKEQLQLDIAVREDQTAVARSKELPFFQLFSGSSRGVSGAESRTYNLHIKNVGPTAISASLEMSPKSKVTLNHQTLGYMEEGKEYKISYEARTDVLGDPDVEITFSIVARSIRGQERTQVFCIENGVPRLQSCVPEAS